MSRILRVLGRPFFARREPCPRCHFRIPRTLSRCPRCGWVEPHSRVNVEGAAIIEAQGGDALRRVQ